MYDTSVSFQPYTRVRRKIHRSSKSLVYKKSRERSACFHVNLLFSTTVITQLAKSDFLPRWLHLVQCMKGRRGTGGSGCSVNSVVYDYEWIRTLPFVIFLWSGIFWFLSFAKFTTEICWEATWIKMRAALGKNHENFLNFWEHDENLIAKTSNSRFGALE